MRVVGHGEGWELMMQEEEGRGVFLPLWVGKGLAQRSLALIPLMGEFSSLN